MLFALQEGELDPEKNEVLNFFEATWEKPDLHFMQKRFKSACKNHDQITEKIIGGLQPGWTLDRIDPVIKIILIVATDEILNGGQETPVEILVKEYADLTADFFNDAETSFVNAYLNGLKHKLIDGEYKEESFHKS